jgi:hypothetical protein
LGKKPAKTSSIPSFERRAASVVSAASTPAVESHSAPVQIPDVVHNRGHGNPLGAGRADQGVVDINVSNQVRSLHVALGRTGWPNVFDLEPRAPQRRPPAPRVCWAAS